MISRTERLITTIMIYGISDLVADSIDSKDLAETGMPVLMDLEHKLLTLKSTSLVDLKLLFEVSFEIATRLEYMLKDWIDYKEPMAVRTMHKLLKNRIEDYLKVHSHKQGEAE